MEPGSSAWANRWGLDRGGTRAVCQHVLRQRHLLGDLVSRTVLVPRLRRQTELRRLWHLTPHPS